MSRRSIKKNFKLFCPQTIADIENIVGNLFDDETSVLVILPKTKVSSQFVDIILSYQSPYISINLKKICSNVFICFSEYTN